MKGREHHTTARKPRPSDEQLQKRLQEITGRRDALREEYFSGIMFSGGHSLFTGSGSGSVPGPVLKRLNQFEAERTAILLEFDRRGASISVPKTPTGAESKPAEATASDTREVTSAAEQGAPQLIEREKKIWEVIQRGNAKGLQYCRELDAASIHHPNSGSWRGCPATYRAAYLTGEPWKHRIQDEKSKIKRRATLAKTRKSLASE